MTGERKQLFIPAVLASIVVMMVMPLNTEIAFADSDKPTVKVADHLKNNPLAIKIITEMEAQKLRYKQQIEQQEEQKAQQAQLEQQRKIAKSNLEQDLRSMQEKYKEYTPKNAFARFVSSLDPTYHPIYWSQFEYLSAKVNLAIAARNTVLQSGGTYFEAQKEYHKYASMPRVEMINLIEDLNVQYGFADEDIQAYFDAYGKLPRYEDDNDAPCYGCERQQKQGISTVSIKSGSDDTKNEIQTLKDNLSELREKFLDEERYEQKKILVKSMNDLVKEIQKLAYDDKSL